MAAYKCGGDQELNADEEKEKSSLMLPGMLSDRESLRGQQEGEHREDTQEDSHVSCPTPKRVCPRWDEVNRKSWGRTEMKPVATTELMYSHWEEHPRQALEHPAGSHS